ncbi:MAG: glycoside hydrolase family 27 protein [Bacteroidota bacterium]|nr:glycoside hydrolase family 27 protein [Bacteroidota bacterium]
MRQISSFALIILLGTTMALNPLESKSNIVIRNSHKNTQRIDEDNKKQPTDLTGAWRVDIAQGDGIVIPTYFILRQNGTVLDGTVSIKSTVDLQIRNPHQEGNEIVFGTDWNISYRLRPEGENLYVTIDYGNGLEKGSAFRVSEAEARPPKSIPLPALKNVKGSGAAQTPPMGWNSWNHFGNRVDDSIVRAAADALLKSGLASLGYVYINIDDCWEGERDARGNIVPNKKFPNMKALADYVHERGLKLGVYSSPGPRTCGGYEGSYGHEDRDAKTYASWGIDYIKYDWCSAQRIYSNSQLQAVYQKMGRALAKSGRPIVYSLCEYGLADVWKWGQQVGGNLWRTGYDIQDNWQSMSRIGFSQDAYAPYAGPGHWNDPDMLEVGNGGMTNTEYRTHFSLWCMLAAPLLAGNDLNNMSAETLEILGNKEVIAIDQDPLGKQAVPVVKNGDIQIFARDLEDGSKAVGLFNLGTTTAKVNLNFSDIKVNGEQKIRDLWLHKDLGEFKSNFEAEVSSHGVVLLKVVPDVR